MKLYTKIGLGVLLLAFAGVITAAVYFRQAYLGAGPAIRQPSGNITDHISDELSEPVNNTDFPLTLPKGFAISIVAKNLPGARVVAQDGFGNLWVSQTSKGVISNLELKDGKVVRQTEVFKNLDKPHGLVIYNNVLYFAEQTKITKVTLYSDDPGTVIAQLPKGGRHYTRTLGIGPDNRLFVSIGSTCDVCNESDERLASIYSMKTDGSDMKKEASGLRNSVFFTWDYVNGKLWATEMGRDMLGDELPPDEINIIGVGPETSSGRQTPTADFGWPICYGKNIHDTKFDKNQYIRDPCADKVASTIDLPAHSAPLGIGFIPEEPAWPEEYWGNMIVAFHGSWNRSQPTGYKLVRIKADNKGNYQVDDFVSGWLAKDGKTALGRPVDVKINADGSMYVTDDKAGVIYKIAYIGSGEKASTGPISNLNIKKDQVVTSPLTIEGSAKGFYFEGSFPIKVLDANRKEIGSGIAQATKDWMTTEPVPFKATVTFKSPTTNTGYIVFMKDNPSGLPENDASFELPVKFK